MIKNEHTMKKLIVLFLMTILLPPGFTQSTFTQRITQGQSTNTTTNKTVHSNKDNGPDDVNVDDEPYVFWIHGLNGDIGSWADASLASESNVAPGFPARKLKSVTDIDYSQSNGLEEAGGQVLRIIDGYRASQLSLGEDPTRNFIISHSQGGMVARSMLQTLYCVDQTPFEDSGFGGVVTYGTPHQGAQILNNKTKFGIMANDMCESLALGPTQEKIDNTNFIFKILGFEVKLNLGRFIRAEEIVPVVCDYVSDALMPLLLFLQTPTITKDYEVGAPYLGELNASCENVDLDRIQKVAFYGVENPYGLMFRTLKYFSLSANAPDYFNATPDYDAIEAVDENRLRYVAMHEHQKYVISWIEAKRRTLRCEELYGRVKFGTECKILADLLKRAKVKASAWKKGVDWFGRVDDQYKIAIGALEFVTRKENWCSCLDRATGLTTEWQIFPGDLCVNGATTRCRAFVKTIVDKVYKDSDGVVLAESASGWEDADHIERLRNSSHMQMRNDENTRSSLFKLYNGNFGSQFQVATR
jgi:hypothetical protein